MLKQLGYENTALGFISGFTGEFIVNTLMEYGINNKFIRFKKWIY